MQDYGKLSVWKKSHLLAISVYSATASFPQHEVYGLTSQIRRAAASIPSNIAEGGGRDGRAELSRFLQMAQGSASELEYQLLLARDLNYLEIEDYKNINDLLGEIRRMLTMFIKRLKIEPS